MCLATRFYRGWTCFGAEVRSRYAQLIIPQSYATPPGPRPDISFAGALEKAKARLDRSTELSNRFNPYELD